MKFHRESVKLLLFIFSLVDLTASQKTINKCGGSNPVIPADCFSYDTTENSCCFYTYKVDVIGCAWLGTKYKGFTQYGALFVECRATINNLKYFSILIFLLILI